MRTPSTARGAEQWCRFGHSEVSNRTAEGGRCPLRTVGEPLAHADNLDGGPRLAGRGLDAAFVERLGRGPISRGPSFIGDLEQLFGVPSAYVPRPAPTRLSIEQNGDKDYSDGISDQDVARFRAQADECRQQAERAINPLDKEAWLRLAGEWIKLAQASEKRT